MDSIDNETRKILKQYIERIERLEEEKNNINNDIKDLLVEAKAKGFVPNIIKQKLLKLEKWIQKSLMSKRHYLNFIKMQLA